MDSQLVHSHHEGEEEHHEKKSVLKMVKAKAKKLKDTITGHGHHEPEGHRTPDDHDLDEEEDEDLGDPEVHGAPIYDSVAATRKTDAPVQGDIFKGPVVKFGDTRAARDDYDPAVPKSSANVSDPTRSHLPGEYGTGRDTATYNTAATSVQGEAHRSGDARGDHYDPVVPKERSNFTTGHENLSGGARTNLTGPTTGPVLHHEESPKEGPPAPYNTPVSSLPQGSHNTSVTDVNPSKSYLSGNSGQQKETNFGKTDVLGEGARGKYDTTTMDVNPSNTFGETNLGQTRVHLGKTDVVGGGTHMPQTHGTDKSAMDVDPKQTFVSGEGGHSSQSKVNLDRPRGLEEDPHTPDSNTPTNYETKVTDPTKPGGEEVGATPILHSFDKMNLHGDDRQYLNNQPPNLLSTGSPDRFESDKTSKQGTTTYTQKISNATSAIAGSAISAKNAVASKLGYGGNESEQSGSSPREHQNRVLDQSTNQFVPAETPKVGGTILEPKGNKPSDQTGSSYTEKISSATSVIAGSAISAKNAVASKLGYGGGGDQVQDSTNVQQPREVAPDDQQGKPITSTVYEKVAGAGSAVMSKIGVGGGGGGGAGKESCDGVDQAAGNVRNVDKGVNVKGYFAEKLKPGEEDKALSEVIKEKLQKQKQGESGGAKPMGKVTESEEVRQRLGDADGNDNFVVERVKENVTSMIGGGDNKADEEPEGHYVAEGRRLQESGN